MRVLVTGGAGFVGSHYVRSLLGGRYPGTAGWSVTVLDALSHTGNRANLDLVDPTADLGFVHGSVTDEELVDRLMIGHDAVVHVAAESHVDKVRVGTTGPVTTNVVGTQVLLDAARRRGVRRFVQVSTDEVYGSIDEGSWTEDRPVSPTSPFAAAKAASDLLALSYQRSFGLDVCVTRCAANYGPYQIPDKLVPLFVTRLLDGRRVPLHGDGSHVRTWVHVDDHCEAIHRVLVAGRPGQIYNVGGRELTDRDLTSLLLQACGADWSVVDEGTTDAGAAGQHHDRRHSLDWSRIRDELGYAPATDLEAGLTATVAWYRANRSWWEPVLARLERTAAADAPIPVDHGERRLDTPH